MNDIYYWKCIRDHINKEAFDALSGPPIGEPRTCKVCGKVDHYPQWGLSPDAFREEFPHKQYPHQKFSSMGYGNVARELGSQYPHDEFANDEKTPEEISPIPEQWQEEYSVVHSVREHPKEIDYGAEIELLNQKINQTNEAQRKQLSILLSMMSEITKIKTQLKKERRKNTQRELEVRIASLEVKMFELADVVQWKFQNK